MLAPFGGIELTLPCLCPQMYPLLGADTPGRPRTSADRSGLETRVFLSIYGSGRRSTDSSMVPVVGVEPTHGCPWQILSLLRLPIPPHRQV